MSIKQKLSEPKISSWLTSNEVKQILKISDCHLMHLRLTGKLEFIKEGRRYFYLLPSEFVPGRL
ncbi:DNA-binding protein [Rheinheimera sediminis]|nr:DNA-binding protein [Rheinheimera sp. YQF-1]